MTDNHEFTENIARFLSVQTGKSAMIDSMTPLAGGASRDSWLIEARIDGVMNQLVLRRDLPTQMNENALTRPQEFAVMQAARDAGVKVAPVRYLCDHPAEYGIEGAFFLMDAMPGISIGRKVIHAPELAPAREQLPAQLAAELAKIHTIDPAPFEFLPRPAAGVSPAGQAVNETFAVLDRLGVQSAPFEFLLRWARQHVPAAGDMTFVHGDFRIGNMLVDASGLSAVIDWEFAHVGDPHEEIGYLCMRDWRFGADHLHAGGLSHRETFIRAYEAASGRTVDRTTVDWWEIMGNIRWGVICLAQAARHLSGDDPAVELASLGRRSAEMQLEALTLIQKMEA